MKFFIDTANVEEIKQGLEMGMVDGVTTNPSLIAREKKSPAKLFKEICAIVDGPVNAEVVSLDAEGMVKEGKKLAKIHKNIVVKIPMTVEGLKAVPFLEQEKKIRTNVTMIFSSTQCFLAMKAGASFVSIVLSRLDAIARESDILLQDAVTIKENFGFGSQVLAASLKTQNHMLSSLRAGADVVTIPDTLLFQMYKHPLTDSGLAAFEQDWAKVRK